MAGLVVAVVAEVVGAPDGKSGGGFFEGGADFVEVGDGHDEGDEDAGECGDAQPGGCGCGKSHAGNTTYMCGVPVKRVSGLGHKTVRSATISPVLRNGGEPMPDRWHPAITRRPQPITTAAATVLGDYPENPRNLFTYTSWQDEAWEFWRSLGELNQGITWLANSLSRVRLLAAEVVPGGDEPEPLDKGVAADLMEAFAGGHAGQSGLMAMLGTQLGVPGEGWLVVERDGKNVPLQLATWKIVPTSALRAPAQGQPAKLRVSENLWRPLSDEGLATKIFKEDPQFPWRPYSVVQAALPVLRRIDLVDRRIVAIMVSRLVMNGILLIPQEGTFSVPKQYKDAADPFLQMFIDKGSNGIARPGTASAALPLLIKFAAEYIEKWRHLKWDDLLPPELLAERDSEIKRLAVTLALPAEWLTGMGDVKFWNAFHLTEEAVNLYVVPYAEIMAGGIAKGYLYPLLKQMGEEPVGPNGGKIIVWYDTSELTAPADKSAAAKDAYDRGEFTGEGLRRELGLDDSDAPDDKALKDFGLKRLLSQPATAPAGLQMLGVNAPMPAALSGLGGGGPSASPPAQQLPPEGPGAPPATAASLRRPSPRPRPPVLTHR